MQLRKGTEVQTLKFGKGKVLEARSVGALVDVGGFSVMVPFEEITVISEVPKAIPSKIGHDAASVGTRAPWLKAIEALRFGIVPAPALDRLTVGYDSLQDWVETVLPTSVTFPRFVQVVGAFGTGKSHTLSAIRHIAAKANCLTLHAELDGVAISMADPAALLYQLTSTIDFKSESPTPLVELCVRAQSRGHAQAMTRLQDLPKVNSNYSTITALKSAGYLDDFEDQLDLLFGGSDAYTASQLKTEIRRVVEQTERASVNPVRMVSVSLDTRSTDFAQALCGYARLAERAGFKGLCVTLDEFETDYLRADRVTQTLDALLHECMRSAPGPYSPITIFLGVVPQDGDESVHTLDTLVQRTNGHTKALRMWSARDLKLLANRIHTLYVQAYELKDKFDETLYKSIELDSSADDAHGHVRTFIKHYLSALDSRVGPPRA